MHGQEQRNVQSGEPRGRPVAIRVGKLHQVGQDAAAGKPGRRPARRIRQSHRARLQVPWQVTNT